MSRTLELISQLKMIEYELDNTKMSKEVVCWWEELMDISNKFNEIHSHWKSANQNFEEKKHIPVEKQTKDALEKKE